MRWNIKPLCYVYSHQVITTCGPRKPQRQSSNANSSIASDFADDIAILNQLPQSPVHNCLLTPSQAQRLCLETSFTGLQTPVQDDRVLVDPDDVSCESSNQIRYTCNSVSEATTVLIDEVRTGRRAVAFDTTREIITTGRGGVIVSPVNLVPRSILQTPQNPLDKRIKKPMSLSFQEVQLSRTISNASSYDNVKLAERQRHRIDLIHDDWFGLAPLASPESLSEISSISSRATSLGKLNFNGSLEREFFMASCQEETTTTTTTVVEVEHEEEENLLIESQMRTPVIMRRAPKINTDLSKCASDSTQLDKYKRMGQVFIAPNVVDLMNDDDVETDSSNGDHFLASISFSRPQNKNRLLSNFCPITNKKRFIEISSSSDSSGSSICGSFKTAQNDDSNIMLIDFNSKSAEFLSVSNPNNEKLNRSEELLNSTGKDELDDSRSKQDQKKMAMSDSAILNDGIEGQTIGIQRPEQKPRKVTIIGSSSDTYHSATSSLSNHQEDGVTFFKQEPITSQMASGVLESHFPVLEEYNSENSSLISSTPPRPIFIRPGTSHRSSSGSPLPLLTNLSSIHKQQPLSPSRFRASPSKSKRKIYPITPNPSNPSSTSSNNNNCNNNSKRAINFSRREESNV